jgi:CheY-like chemotaxis protein
MATVLVVDDDPTILRLVARLLEGTDHEIVGEATDGHAAVAAFSEHHPDVVILDHMMPGITGLDAAELMLAERPGQPIVMFTAYADRELFEQATGIGIAACLAKTDVRRLCDVLDEVLA